jgi:putative ABC transport system permease protein
MRENLTDEIRFACRALWRTKAFTAAAVLTLAIGIAGATVMLALVQGVLLRPLPVSDQDRLVIVWKELRSSGYAHYPFGDAEIEAVGKASRLLESVAGVTMHGVSRWVAIDDTATDYVSGALVTGSFFEVLGVSPVLGRALQAEDDVEGSENVVVISSGLWRRRFGGTQDVLGRRLTLDEQSFRIVGVMPRDIDYPHGVEVWRTTRSVPTTGTFGDAARQEVDLIGRLRPGVTIDQAAAELTSLIRQRESIAAASAPRGLTPVVRSFEDAIVGNTRSVIVALLVAVVIVVMIASANVANLLLMRGEARRTELAVRSALGASRTRVVRQALIESALLSLLAAAAGLAAARWSLQPLITLVPDGLPRVESVRIDAIVVMLVAGVSLCTSLLAGAAPALLAVRLDLVSQLRGGGRGIAGAGARRGRRTLVVTQVALAVTVVAAAGLLIRSVLRLQSVDTGLITERLVFVNMAMPQQKYAERPRHAQFLADLMESLQAVRGLDAATAVNFSPFSGGWGVPKFAAEGQSEARAASNPSVTLESVHDNYFETLGIRIVKGRAFTAADREGAVAVAIVSEDVAARTWPGENPLGKRLKMGSPGSRDRWRTVVGVAATTRYRDLAVPQATLYLPAAQFIDAAQTLAVRTSLPIDQVAAIVRDRVRASDPDVHVIKIASFPRVLDVPLARPRFNAFLLGVFGVAALLLATIGHYAVIATYVRQQEREIAVRVALGATPGHVRGLVLGEALSLSGTGAAIGLAGAVGAARVLRGMLFGVDGLDPVSLIGAMLLLTGASILASWWPVRRAMRVTGLRTVD